MASSGLAAQRRSHAKVALRLAAEFGRWAYNHIEGNRTMKRAGTVTIVAALGLSLFICGSTKQETEHPKIWAAISVPHPLFYEGWTNEVVMDFAIFNSSDKPFLVSPCINSSKLVINGEELKGKDLDVFYFILNNGPREQYKPFPSGRGFYFNKAVGHYFQKPGIYSVAWRGDCFESAPLVFRVMPRQDKDNEARD